MIRRDAVGPDGRPVWLLISQIEHARLAGVLAADWGGAPWSSLPARDELLPAIYRHDDGWAQWEQLPEVDGGTGRPRDFLEMPLDQTLVIWRKSIERAAEMSFLGGYAVAGHFRNLMEHAEVWRDQGSRLAAAAHQWVAEVAAEQQQWLDAWCSRHPSTNTAATAIAARDWLQFFDRLSLWFCMGERSEPTEMATPAGLPLRLVPGKNHTISLVPWPLSVQAVDLSLVARMVPQRRYMAAADLAGEGHNLMTLRLQLMPGEVR